MTLSLVWTMRPAPLFGLPSGSEATGSSFRGLAEAIERNGPSCSLYTDRGRHDCDTAEAGGKVSRTSLTQVGRALNPLGIEPIAVCPAQEGSGFVPDRAGR
jgi:hypothetical protein